MEKKFDLIQLNLPMIGIDYFGRWYIGLDELGIEFQKGVFEKFIAKDGLDITVDGYLGDETYGISGSSPTFTDWKWFDNFKQLLLWYFNN
jgi:hypothetical protein